MADSATDVGVHEVKDVYVCYLVVAETNTFVSFRECSNNKAAGIKEALDSAMANNSGDWKDRTVAVGSDGASVTLVDRGGVYALLKQEIPHLIKLHCIPHHLELAFSVTLLVIPDLTDVKDMLQGIRKQYHYSPKAVH